MSVAGEMRNMEKLKGKLSLLMPAYNEGAGICQNALLAAQQIKDLADDYELLVINDGSSDNTREQAELAAKQNPHIRCISYPDNMGKGYALKTGTAAATGEYIAFCDADMELAPSQLAGFVAIMQEKGADAVIASKMHPQSQVNYPVIRKVYSWGYYMLLLVLFRLNTRDTQTGLKLFRASVLKPAMEKILVKRFAFDIEVLAIINSRGYTIESAPIRVHFQRGNFGRIGFADIRNMFVDTLAVFYRLKILHYYD